MASANKAELDAIEAALQQFRVNELHILLSSFKCPKLGKKTELVHRCRNLLQTARNQAAVIQKIREISSSRRYNSLGLPSSPLLYNMDSNATMNGSVYNSVMTLSSALMQHQYVNTHHPFSSQMDRVKTLHIADLPFYDKLQTLLDLTELQGNLSGIRSTSHATFTFSIPCDVMPQIMYRNESTALPRTEIQLRFFLVDYFGEQHDEFPPDCNVKIDDAPVTLPNVIPTNKINAEPRRPSRPVNITPYCQPPRDAIRPHRITVEWTSDKRSWVLGIYVVSRLTSDILLRRLLANVNALRDAGDTMRIIKTRLSGDDDAVQMETLRISLLCPLGKTRMKIPVKADDCTHLQCFDLSNYLKMNEKRPTWKCAVCDNSAPYKKLVIDGYFEKVLSETSSDVTEIELLHDGGWQAVAEELDTVSDGEEEVGYWGDSKSCFQNARNNVSNNNSRPNSGTDDVIILDSDDEDEVFERSQERNRLNKYPKKIPTPQVVCIDLDESDSLVLSPQTCHSSRASSVQTSFSNTVSLGASTSSTTIPIVTPTVEVTAQANNMNPVIHHYAQQQQTSHSAQPMPYFTPGPVQFIQPPDTVMPGTSSPNYFHPFEQPFPYYQQEFNARLIAEELRQFMAKIQQTTNFPKYT